MHAKRSQSGYLMEIPLIMAVVGVLLAVLIPHLSIGLRKGLLVLGTLVWLGGLYYMIVIPGWQPRNRSYICRVWKLIIFLVLLGFFGVLVGVCVLGTL